MCNSNFVFKTFPFSDTWLQKMSWPWNLGQRSLKVIESGTIRYIGYGFLLVFYRNFVPKMHRYWDIQLQNCCDLEHWVRGPSRSLEMSPFNRAHTTSYLRPIVTIALSCVICDIFNVEKCRDLEIRVKSHSRSSKMIPFDPAPMTSY